MKKTRGILLRTSGLVLYALLVDCLYLLHFLQDIGRNLLNSPLKHENNKYILVMVSLLVSMSVVLAEAVVSLVAPLVVVFVDVATREMRGAGSLRKT